MLQTEHVLFLRSKYYHFGSKISNKASLLEVLTEDDMVQFDASRCSPTAENKNCTWMARAVWKGKKPTS